MCILDLEYAEKLLVSEVRAVLTYFVVCPYIDATGSPAMKLITMATVNRAGRFYPVQFPREPTVSNAFYWHLACVHLLLTSYPSFDLLMCGSDVS